MLTGGEDKCDGAPQAGRKTGKLRTGGDARLTSSPQVGASVWWSWWWQGQRGNCLSCSNLARKLEGFKGEELGAEHGGKEAQGTYLLS
jgi:hypothetical protein